MLRITIVLIGLAFLPKAMAAEDAIELLAPGKTAISVDVAALAKLPRSKVSAGSHDAAPSEWEGATLSDVLQLLDAPRGKTLHGAALTTFVRITSSDGYQMIFSLAELDADFSNIQVLVVDHQDGKSLSAETGPFRLVVAGDKRAARWVRNVRKIELVSAGDSVRVPAAHGDDGKH